MTDTADVAAGNAKKTTPTSKGSKHEPKSKINTKQTSKSTPLTPSTRPTDNSRAEKRHSLLRRQSSLLFQHLQSSLPTTPTTWALLSLSLCSALLQYELRLQKSLSCPPDVFCSLHSNRTVREIYDRLSGEGGIFVRSAVPSLFVGTRGVASSLAAYALPRGDGSNSDGRGPDKTKVGRVREVMTMGADGARIVLDWELPQSMQRDVLSNSNTSNHMVDEISQPVVLLVHGMNNDSTFGYVRSMMRTATSRGWVAVCMNLRGQDGEGVVKNTTPRGYNAGFTGDLRGVILQIEKRLVKKPQQDNDAHNQAGSDSYIGGPIYLVGYSLGANIITKYLGEESLHGTLPKCIGGGAALGNPLHISSNTIGFPWNMILAMGVKRSLLQNLAVYRKHHERGFQRAMKKAMLSRTIGQLDDSVAPYILRVEPEPPFAPKIGYRDGKEYWHDSSSHRYVGHVSVPLLKITAKDDFLVFGQFSRKLNHCLENPNVVVVKTRCGGHLGWQESPPPTKDANGNVIQPSWFGSGIGSWSDVAVADFIEALIDIRKDDIMRREQGGVKNAEDAALPKIVSRL